MPKFEKKKLARAANLILANNRKTEIDINNNLDSIADMNINSPIIVDLPDLPIDSELTENDKCCQTDFEKMAAETSTQTFEFEKYKNITFLQKSLDINLLVDFIYVFKSIVIFDEKIQRVFSCFVYVFLRYLELPFAKCKELLKQLDLLSGFTCHQWTLKTIENDDPCALIEDDRGVQEYNIFYEHFPELEVEAKAFLLSAGERRNCSFTVLEFAQFVDERFRELYVESIDPNSDATKFVRFEF